jgi:DNA polymerase-3 subunit beta
VQPTESPDAFPAVPDFDCAAYHTLTVADMKRLVKRTLHAVDAESVQYALGGMLAESSGPDLAFVATDGHVLSRQSVPATLTGDVWSGESQRVIPASTLNTLVAMLADGGSDVSIGFPDDQSVRFRFGDTVFSGQLLNGRFPPWRKAESRILPESTRTVRVACEALRAATEQASVLSSSETRRVMYAFSEGACRLAASDAGSGVSDVEFPLPWEGDPLSIDLDPTYLVPMLKSSAGDVEVECRTTPMDNPNAAFVVATDDGFLGWVMAMSREAAR